MNEHTNLLEIKDLTVHYVTVDGTVHAVENLNLTLPEGKTLGLVGETGAGKTTTVKAIMQILPDPPAKILNGEVIFCGEDLLKKNKKSMRKIRGKQISMIFQDPMTSLNPVITVGEQIMEVIRLHDKKMSKKDAYTKACEMLELVGIKADRAGDYPHQFSGGMKQRVIIAMAVCCKPKLIIADEPTTALDVTIQAQILELMQDLQKKLGMAVILVTHDLGVIADMCDNIIVMYGGRICERGTAREIFYNPKHEYTKGLLRSIPNVNNMKKKLVPIAGTPINMLNLPAGCAFCTRCDAAMKICLSEHPEEMAINENHRAACWINVRDQLMNAEGGEQNV